MYKKSKLYEAITMAVASSAVGVSGSALAQEGDHRRLEEVVVTASKRVESMQDIPIAVQAMNAEMLENRDINTFEDWVKNAPSVNFSGRGPGQNTMFIRGIAVDPANVFQGAGLGPGPSVALYLDDAPLISSGRNIDLYVTDMQQIEVLPGPQGTLYGASSQAGTVRLVHNKPVLNEFGGNIEVSGSTTNKGEGSWGVEGALNIPVIEDRLAVRLTGYEIHKGGYIDNVPATKSFAESEAIGTRFAIADDAEFRERDNADRVEDDFNDTYYRGGRIYAKLAINQDWDLTAGFLTQKIEADGVFDFAPSVGDLKVERFENDNLDDEFHQFNWKLEGRMAWLDVVYNGSYLEREIQQEIDYVSAIEDLGFLVFYNCSNDGGFAFGGEVDLCAAPDARFNSLEKSDFVHHEFRISTDKSKPVHLVGGIWYTDETAGLSQEWRYHSPQLAGLTFPENNFPVSGATNFVAGPRDSEVAFFNDIIRKTDELAFFGELTYDVTDWLSATFGIRRSMIDVRPLGSFNPATFGPVDTDAGGTLDELEAADENDTIFKGNLTFRPNQDMLFYATFSEGFRRGGFNRQGDVINQNTGEVAFPGFFRSDKIDNYEIGWKLDFLDGRVRFNGAAYKIDWSGIQVSLFDPERFGNLNFTANAGEADIKGVEGDFTILLTNNLTMTGAFSINDTELESIPEAAEANILPEGTDLALTPTFQGNLGFRYDFLLAGEVNSYAQVNVQRRGSTFSSLDVNDTAPLDDYTTLDASVGMDLGQWKVSLRGTNLTDKRTELFKSTLDGPARTVTDRPRTLGFRVSYDF